MNAISSFCTVWAGLMLLAPLVAAVAAIVQQKIFPSRRILARLYLRYLLRIVALHLGLILYLPLLLLFFIIGPGALMAGAIALTALIAYLIEQGIGYDIGSAGLGSSDISVSAMFGLLLLAGISLFLFMKATEANLAQRWLNELLARGRALLAMLDDWLPQ